MIYCKHAPTNAYWQITGYRPTISNPRSITKFPLVEIKILVFERNNCKPVGCAFFFFLIIITIIIIIRVIGYSTIYSPDASNVSPVIVLLLNSPNSFFSSSTRYLSLSLWTTHSLNFTRISSFSSWTLRSDTFTLMYVLASCKREESLNFELFRSYKRCRLHYLSKLKTLSYSKASFQFVLYWHFEKMLISKNRNHYWYKQED